MLIISDHGEQDVHRKYKSWSLNLELLTWVQCLGFSQIVLWVVSSRHVWTDEETEQFLDLVHERNITDVISDDTHPRSATVLVFHFLTSSHHFVSWFVYISLQFTSTSTRDMATTPRHPLMKLLFMFMESSPKMCLNSFWQNSFAWFRYI